MATDLDFKIMPVQATADLSGASSEFKAVTFGGAIAPSNLQAAGILRYGAKSGETLSVMYMGVHKAQFGTAVGTVGYPLKITTSGFVIAASSGDSTIGRSVSVTASGDIAQAYFDFRTFGYSVVA